MKLVEKLLKDFFEPVIRSRGFFYFQDNLVSNVKIDGLEVHAVVEGTDDYDVEIEFDPNYDIEYMECTCPYGEDNNCKHEAAVLYYLDNKGYFPRYTAEDEQENIIIEDGKGNNSNETKAFNIFSINNSEQKKNTGFLQFENKIQKLIPENKKPAAKRPQNQKFVFGIDISSFRTYLHVIRQRLREDGSVAEQSIVHEVDPVFLKDMSLQEKITIDYITRFTGNFYVEMGQTYEWMIAADDKRSRLFSDLLESLADKEVYLYEGYHEFGNRLYIQENEAKAVLVIDEDTNNIILKLTIQFDGIQTITGKPIVPVIHTPLWVIIDDKIVKVPNLTYKQFSEFVSNKNGIKIPKTYLSYFANDLLPKLVQSLDISSNKFEIEEINNKNPHKRIYFEEKDSKLYLSLKFLYESYLLDYNGEEAATYFSGEKIVVIKRDTEYEYNAASEIKKFYVREVDKGIYTPRNNPVKFLFDNLSKIKEAGFELFGEADLKNFKVNTSKPKFSFGISSGINWFDVSANIDFGGIGVSLSELFNSVKGKKNYIQLNDGSIGLLPDEWIKKFERTILFGKMNEEGIRFSNAQAPAIELLIEDAESVNTDDKFKERIERLHNFTSLNRMKIPEGLNAILRDYQHSGYEWLNFLKEYEFGGILADDMGLGKTIQTITLLLNEKSNGIKTASLVVAPTSVVFNWIKEIEKFAPSLKVLEHGGKERIKDDINHFDEYDIILTSYPILLRDGEILSKYNFHYIILDESQKIKNPDSKTAKIVRILKSGYKLCLTGTPIENNLLELWSQMSFLNPGLLGSVNNYKQVFIKSIQMEENDSSAGYLRKLIYPFILRRTKDIVATELPEKTEIIQYCEMVHAQEKVYSIWRESIRNDLMKEINEKGIKRSGIKIIEGLLRLRQICNHPVLVKNDYKDKSGKFEEFQEKLIEVIEEDHKVLVFSQFVQMLDIIKTYLNRVKIKYEYLTGNTKNREECVNNFQNDKNIKVFLISLKAGGFGLNLTAADYVFHYDPWWNPAVEVQATDRTHRIGQDKNVFVYKFITKDSVEEKILQLQNSKRDLAEKIISNEKSIFKNLTKEDVEVLFS